MVLVPTPFDDWWHNYRGGKKLVSTIKVLTNTKLCQLQIRIGRDEPISTIFTYVQKYRDDKEETDFELRTVFPIVAFRKSDTRTLRQMDLYPRRALELTTDELADGQLSVALALRRLQPRHFL